jgi:predicted Fe-S protein YdhL (DUF1289 family)
MSHAALPRAPMPASIPSDLPASPCVRNCCLDDGDVCLGCGRHLAEILAWHQADADARRAILGQAAQRLAARRERLAG